MIIVLNESPDWRWKIKDECYCGAILQVDSESMYMDFLEGGKKEYYYYCPKCGRKNFVDEDNIKSMPEQQRIHLKSKRCSDTWFSTGFGKL